MAENFIVSTKTYVNATKESLKQRIATTSEEIDKAFGVKSVESQSKVNKLAFDRVFDKLVSDEFSSYDKNNDGKLSEDEAKEINFSGNAVTGEKDLSNASKLASGKSEKELIESLSNNRNILERIFLTSIAKFFKKADVNENGTMEKEEVDTFLEKEFPKNEPFVEFGVNT